MKEYTFQEVIANIKNDQKYVCVNEGMNIQTIEKIGINIKISYSNTGRNTVVIGLDFKFKLVRKPVAFMEAAQALSKNKKVYCLLRGKKYDYKTVGGFNCTDGLPVWLEQILEGKWYIDEN